MRSLPIIAVLLTACGASTKPASTSDGPAAEQITLIYQSRVDGEIEPCG